MNRHNRVSPGGLPTTGYSEKVSFEECFIGGTTSSVLERPTRLPGKGTFESRLPPVFTTSSTKPDTRPGDVQPRARFELSPQLLSDKTSPGRQFPPKACPSPLIMLTIPAG